MRRLASQRPALVLTGARQTGKTSLLRHLFPDHGFVTLDLPADAAIAEDDPETFLSQNPPPLVVDEVQYAPRIFRNLKADIDAHRKDNGRFVLTGSQKFLLMKGVSDSLAGRAAILELEPLSWSEIHRALPTLRLEQVLLRGGYPELYDQLALDHRAYYRSYFATYLERDVRALQNVGSLRDFERFVRACALRSAQLLNKAELARDVGISAPTANQWLSVLTASNQTFLLEPWFSNRSKSVVKSPKLYWGDAGFLAWLLGIQNEEELARSPYAGAIWETFVYSELRKRQTAVDGGTSLFFWRDRGKEVDFLIHRGGSFELMEAKWTRAPAERDVASLAEVARILGDARVTSRRVICRSERSYPLRGAQIVGPSDRWFEGDTSAATT
ncbi:MAG: ATP-binding protein [Deltaproteobacteria bacterium]|nr:ATP-binding protein [Deltaproteobacteria bacterium]